MSSWNTSPWSNNCDPHWELIWEALYLSKKKLAKPNLNVSQYQIQISVNSLKKVWSKTQILVLHWNWLLLLDPWLWLEWSYESGYVCLSFLRIGSLVFSETQHGVVVHDRVGYFQISFLSKICTKNRIFWIYWKM